MLKRLDGEISVVICLSDKDMARLRDNEKFKKYATYGTYIG
jgi:hypothetical protein